MSEYNKYALVPYSDELYHHGVKGMKWGVRKRVANAVGNYHLFNKNKRYAYRFNKKANKWNEKAKNRKSGSLLQRHAEQKATNYKEFSKTERNISKMNVGERFVRNHIFSSERFNTPYQRLSGRTTTYGRNAIGNALTGGLANAVLDIKYLKENAK